MKNSEDLEKELNINFNNKELLLEALTHKSYAFENAVEYYNERLEFLGDAVLSLIISDYFYKSFPEMNEGDLSKTRAKLVSKDACFQYAQKINLGEYLLLGKGEEASRGRKKSSNLANAFEAFLGAIYLDKGFVYVYEFIQNIIDIEASLPKANIDFKSELQQYTQKLYKILPKYIIHTEKGPAHNKDFEIHVLLNDKTVGIGTGKTKKEAEQLAAKDALEKFNTV